MFIKPVETIYHHTRFRSRLEARWAVFFDALGMTWEYEPEKFTLPDGRWYIPDFRLQGEVWAEVKPSPDDAFEKAKKFPGQILLLGGEPGTDPDNLYRVWNPIAFPTAVMDCEFCGAAWCEVPEHIDRRDEWVFVGSGDSDPFFYWSYGGGRETAKNCSRNVSRAIYKARSERFGAY